MEAACEVLTVLLNYQSEWDISHKTNCQSLSLHPQLEPVTSPTLYLCLPLMAQATCTASWLTYTSSTRRLTNSIFKISSFPAGRVYPLRIQSAAKPSAHNSLWYKQCYTMRALSHSAPHFIPWLQTSKLKMSMKKKAHLLVGSASNCSCYYSTTRNRFMLKQLQTIRLNRSTVHLRTSMLKSAIFKCRKWRQSRGTCQIKFI